MRTDGGKTICENYSARVILLLAIVIDNEPGSDSAGPGFAPPGFARQETTINRREFAPVGCRSRDYHRYTDDLKQINDEKYALLKSYAQMWGDMSDQDALIHIRRWLEVDQKVQELRLKYVPLGQSGTPREKDRNVFSVGPAYQHDDGCAAIIADSFGAREKEYRRPLIRCNRTAP